MKDDNVLERVLDAYDLDFLDESIGRIRVGLFNWQQFSVPNPAAKSLRAIADGSAIKSARSDPSMSPSISISASQISEQHVSSK